MKVRLTISLSDTLLKQVDQIIDKRTIRNRSHAIEHILSKSLRPTISTAVILAGGSKNLPTPKSLTMINDKPLIIHTLEHLKKNGVSRVIIATNPEGKAIEKLIKDGSQFDLKVEYAYEEKPLGTAGAIKALSKKLHKQHFYVLSADILTTINLQELAAFHFKHKAEATVAVKPRPTHATYDNVFVQGHTVVDFQASTKNQVVSIVNASIYVFSPSIFKHLPSHPGMLEKDVFPKLAEGGQVVAFPFQGVWFDISTDTNYQSALERIS